MVGWLIIIALSILVEAGIFWVAARLGLGGIGYVSAILLTLIHISVSAVTLVLLFVVTRNPLITLVGSMVLNTIVTGAIVWRWSREPSIAGWLIFVAMVNILGFAYPRVVSGIAAQFAITRQAAQSLLRLNPNIGQRVEGAYKQGKQQAADDEGVVGDDDAPIKIRPPQ
jgi:hypothetical protein